MQSEIANVLSDEISGCISSESSDTIIANGFHKTMANGNPSESVLRDATADHLRKRMQEIKEECAYINNRINDIMSKDMKKTEIMMKGSLCNKYQDKYQDKKQSSKEGGLPDKEFIERNSVLTDLFEITHIRTVYNMFMVTLILLALNTVANDMMESRTLSIGTVVIQEAFRKFSMCFYIWMLMQITTLWVYVGFNLWAYQRLKLSPKFLKFWDYSWLVVYILYQILFIAFPTMKMLDEDLPIGCSLIVLIEQIRFIMKSHAFVRSTAPKFLLYKPHSEIPRPNGPRFSQYLYFLFAPTLVYRDNYPRTGRIRWMVVVKNFAEVGLVIFYLAIIVERFIRPVFHVFGKVPLDQKWYIKHTIEASIPGILFFLSGNYLLLHAWLNAWAELLQFADRMFYKDWWNCTSYRMYYRTWNVVVHDWLYTYIYKEMYELIVPCNKVLSAFAVFFISAIFHEYIIAFSFRFFYPVMLVLFGGLGFLLIFAGKFARTNVFMWLSFCLGNGFMFSLYAMEFYARLNCSPHPNKYMDLFLPRSWNCGLQQTP